MDEHVFADTAAAGGRNETVALLHIEEFHRACRHRRLLKERAQMRPPPRDHRVGRGSEFSAVFRRSHPGRASNKARASNGTKGTRSSGQDQWTGRMYRHRDPLSSITSRIHVAEVTRSAAGHGYRSGPSKSWLKTKNPDSPAMQRLNDGNWE